MDTDLPRARDARAESRRGPRSLPLVLALLLPLAASGCELVGDIFRAGFWTAVVLIALVLAAAVWLMRAIGGRGRPGV